MAAISDKDKTFVAVYTYSEQSRDGRNKTTTKTINYHSFKDYIVNYATEKKGTTLVSDELFKQAVTYHQKLRDNPERKPSDLLKCRCIR